MHDAGLVHAVFHFTGLDVGNRLGDIHGNGAALGVGHEAFGTKYAGDFTHDAHHVGRSDANVKPKPVLGLDLFDQVIVTDEIGARLFGFLGLVALGEHENANLFARAVRQNHRTAHLLIGMARVNAQADGRLHGFIKLSLTGGNHHFEALTHVVELGTVDQLYAVLIFLSVLHML